MQITMSSHTKSVPTTKPGLWTRFKNKIKSTNIYQKIVTSERFQKIMMSKPVLWTIEKWLRLKFWTKEKWAALRSKFKNR
jgi:hypothetical protein